MTATRDPGHAGPARSPFARFGILRWGRRAPLVPVIQLAGPIGTTMPLRSGLTLAGLAGSLKKAFAYRHAAAVALAINSPGGSPVQSHLIHGRIRSLAGENGTPVYAFCEDVAASGGYMLALAGDEIYADPSSIVGSIGVISAGFGFDRLIEKIGIDRRVYTAGKSKLTLDPFQPEKTADVKRLKALQQDVHDMFIALVRERRGERLADSDDALFSGEFWSGRQAKALGLVDGLGDMRTILRDRFGEEVRLRPVGGGRGWLARRLAGRQSVPPLPSTLPAGWADELIATLEARALWARYGL